MTGADERPLESTTTNAAADEASRVDFNHPVVNNTVSLWMIDNIFPKVISIRGAKKRRRLSQAMTSSRKFFAQAGHQLVKLDLSGLGLTEIAPAEFMNLLATYDVLGVIGACT